ncbi:hypothetical protein [Oryzomicrobium sp.]|uniref:hypothetical protein n=1 Tax=Oryzomicrobium sp. TaxID=1911578 RepID=UPI002FE0F569
MRSIVAIMLLTAAATAGAEQLTFRDRYNAAAAEMVPVLKTTGCKAKKATEKTITECELQASNALLTLDSQNNRLTSVWLMFDSTQLGHPSDTVRAGGMLLRAARGSSYGDYLAVALNAFDKSRRQGWSQACVDDKESSSRFCVSGNERGIFNITIRPI